MVLIWKESDDVECLVSPNAVLWIRRRRRQERFAIGEQSNVPGAFELDGDNQRRSLVP